MKSMLNTVVILGVAFLASGLIQLAMRRTIDPDIIVGGVFLVSALVIRLVRK
jgi:hypothetical protein